MRFWYLGAAASSIVCVVAQGGTVCTEQVNALAAGIQQNIVVQQGENSSATAIGNLLAAGSVDPNQFNTAKATLLSYVTAGVAIRQNNQAITPSGNAALSGLAIVADAQKMELAMSAGLTGNPATDSPTVKTLLSAFAGGMRQNMQNLLDATKGCTPSDPAAAAGIQVATAAGLKTTAPSPAPAPASAPAPSSAPASSSTPAPASAAAPAASPRF